MPATRSPAANPGLVRIQSEWAIFRVQGNQAFEMDAQLGNSGFGYPIFNIEDLPPANLSTH